MGLPCGQCIGCKQERAKQWAIRMMHETSLYTSNSYITLTYNEQNYPEDHSLDKTHFQLFMKRLRKKYEPKIIRYYQCGEYGDENGRPHYHAILFNHEFEDQKFWKMIKGNKHYTSETLDKLWQKGYCTISDVTFDTCSYVASYITKKVTGKKADKHYRSLDPSTGEILQLQPEYSTMSRRPGIGKEWYDKFKGDAYPSDFLIQKGHKMKPPAYYDKLYAEENPEKMEAIKDERERQAILNQPEDYFKKLIIKKTIKQAQLRSLIRGLHKC